MSDYYDWDKCDGLSLLTLAASTTGDTGYSLEQLNNQRAKRPEVESDAGENLSLSDAIKD